MIPLLKFNPVLMSKPWGGAALWTRLHKGRATDERMGESWELSDRPEGRTLIAEGPFAGQSLADILAQYGLVVMGDTPGFSAVNPVFPLLYKFISAREKLSVQVHPGVGSPLGEAKTECWYVVDAAPGAELIVGVNPDGRTREETLNLLKSAECESVLQRLPAHVGDVFFIPAGTVHAITEGLLLYELQQNSDTTFRLYDWGRVDAQGKPRALHIDEAVQVSDTHRREGFSIPALRIKHESHAEDVLVACTYFVLNKWSGFGASTAPALLTTEGRFRVVSVIAGSASLRTLDGQVMNLVLGDTVLVPACHARVEVEASADTELLVSFVPDLERDVRAPLRAAGHSHEAIDALFGPPGLKV
jgi:mannose-6-phosphate isomerase